MLTRVTSLDLADALVLQGHVIDLAASDGGKPVACCIVDLSANQLSAACMDGAKAPSIDVAHAKAVTAVRYARATVEFRFKLDPNRKQTEWVPAGEDGWDEEDVMNALGLNNVFCSWPGGVPILKPLSSQIVGALGISNRKELEDHAHAVAAIDAWARGMHHVR